MWSFFLLAAKTEKFFFARLKFVRLRKSTAKISFSLQPTHLHIWRRKEGHFDWPIIAMKWVNMDWWPRVVVVVVFEEEKAPAIDKAAAW